MVVAAVMSRTTVLQVGSILKPIGTWSNWDEKKKHHVSHKLAMPRVIYGINMTRKTPVTRKTELDDHGLLFTIRRIPPDGLYKECMIMHLCIGHIHPFIYSTWLDKGVFYPWHQYNMNTCRAS